MSDSEASASTDQLGALPEAAWFAPQMITEDAYSAAQMLHEKRIGATEAMAQACVELSAALGWPRGISHGPLPWIDLLNLVSRLRAHPPYLTAPASESMRHNAES